MAQLCRQSVLAGIAVLLWTQGVLIDARCVYSGSQAVFRGPTEGCSIDYVPLTNKETPAAVIRQEYSARCPERINSTTQVFRVGGLGIRGSVAFYDSYRDTFESHLNEDLACTRGLLFQAVALSYQTQDTAVSKRSVDFVFSNPSVSTCFLASYGVRPILSQVSHRMVDGHDFRLNYFGGNIFVRNDSAIRTIDDLHNKTISAVHLSSDGGMQLQWLYLLQRQFFVFSNASMVMFAGNQRRVVFDVMNGRADAGFVRTDQIEGMAGLRLTDNTLFAPESMRILEPSPAFSEYADADGVFPFASTTPLVPEWPLAMQPHVRPELALAVINSLASLVATDDAAVKGQIAAWRPAHDYFAMIKLNINLGLMDVSTGQCTPSNDIYTPITCPPGYTKKSRAAVEQNCREAQLADKPGMADCFNTFYDEALGGADGPAALANAIATATAAGYTADATVIADTDPYQCICSPCSPVPLNPVVIAPENVVRDNITYQNHDLRKLLNDSWKVDGDLAVNSWEHSGLCERLKPCFTVQQGDTLVVRVSDMLGKQARKQLGMPLMGNITYGLFSKREDELSLAQPLQGVEGVTVSWDMVIPSKILGSVFIQVFADGKNIDASPFGIIVVARPVKSHLAGWAIAVILVCALITFVATIGVVVVVRAHVARPFTLEEHYAQIASQLLGDIEFVKLLGTGSFGKVYHAVWQGSHVAVKVIEHVNATVIQMAEREARLCTRLAHPNIVMTLHYAVRGPDGAATGSANVKSSSKNTTQVGFLVRALAAKRSDRSANDSDQAKSTGRIGAASGKSGLGSSQKSTMLTRACSALGTRTSTTPDRYASDRWSREELNTGGRGAKTPRGHALAEGAGGTQQAPDVVVVLPVERGSASGGAGEARPVGGGARGLLHEESEEEADFDDGGGGKTWGTFTDTGPKRVESSRSTSKSSQVADDVPPETRVQTWIILEYCDKGSLSAVMKTKAFRTAEGEPRMYVVLQTVLDVAKGMQYLHEKGIVHSDLKTGNVLLQSRGEDPRGFRAKVADFGLSRSLEDGTQTINTNTFGTITHMPPELLKDGRLTEAADVFSFGILMWEVFTGEHPYRKCSHAEIVTKVVVRGERPEWPAGCSKLFANVAMRCWAEKESDRPTFEMVVAQLDGMSSILA